MNAMQNSTTKKQLFAKVIVEGKQVKFQLDAGATCNTICKVDLPSSVMIKPTLKTFNL